MRVIAIDWSGSVSDAYQRRKIWLAEVADGRVTRLESGRTRAEVVEHLIDVAARDRQTIIGLDFAFSLPAWFLARLGLASAKELWAMLARQDLGIWLAERQPPFWGRPGSRRPEDLPDHFRAAERALEPVAGIRPKSVFQVSVPGAVGAGSLRGMPLLNRLSAAGFSIWPFDRPDWPQVIEIYPRALTGPVRKTDRQARLRYLTEQRPALGDALRRCTTNDGSALDAAVASDDAFDAAVSALVMGAHLRAPVPRPVGVDGPVGVEGWIWRP